MAGDSPYQVGMGRVALGGKDINIYILPTDWEDTRDGLHHGVIFLDYSTIHL